MNNKLKSRIKIVILIGLIGFLFIFISDVRYIMKTKVTTGRVDKNGHFVQEKTVIIK